MLEDVTVSDTGVQTSAPIYTSDQTTDNWPCVWIPSRTNKTRRCCVCQLLGLTQFSVVPRHPQSRGTKYVNWGYGRLGIISTTVYAYSASRPDADVGVVLL